MDVNVAAYEVANGTGYWGGLVDSLSIAGWGTVNFFSGFANGASGVVNFAADLAANAAVPGCQLAAFGVDPGYCIDVPDIPMIPIAGDPDLYTWSQRTGSFTFVAMATVATGGIGAGGFSASASVAVANATGLTAIRSGVSWVRAVAPQISTYSRTFFTNASQAVRTATNNASQRFSAINWADDTGSIQLGGHADDAASAAEIIESTARAQASRGADELAGALSPAEQAAMKSQPWLQKPMLGQSVHRETALALERAFPGRFQYSTRGPDFLDTLTGEVLELTTPGQVSAHLARPGYSDVTMCTYILPAC